MQVASFIQTLVPGYIAHDFVLQKSRGFLIPPP